MQALAGWEGFAGDGTDTSDNELPSDSAAAARSDAQGQQQLRPDGTQKSVRFADERGAATCDAAVSLYPTSPGLLLGARTLRRWQAPRSRRRGPVAGATVDVINRPPRSPSYRRLARGYEEPTAPEGPTRMTDCGPSPRSW